MGKIAGVEATEKTLKVEGNGGDGGTWLQIILALID
jgi:hypothetical protein